MDKEINNEMEVNAPLDNNLFTGKENVQYGGPEYNAEEINEIITAVPNWIVKWGITIISAIIVSVVLLSSLIRYPDVIRTSVRIISKNAPKGVFSKRTGKLLKILVNDGDFVKEKQVLAYQESTADHRQVLNLLKNLVDIRDELSESGVKKIQLPTIFRLGELQSEYQKLYQEYQLFVATEKEGYLLKQVDLLKGDLIGITKLRQEIIKQQKIQQQEYKNSEQEYLAYKKLYENKVISRSEFITQENKFLSAKYPLQQSKVLLLDNDRIHISKEKDILEISSVIKDARSKFIQSLNQCISETEKWVSEYILHAPVSGHVSFSGVVQANQNLLANQEIFVINPEKSNFYGEINIPQYNMGNVHLGANVLIRMQSYPYEQFGILKGEVTKLADVVHRDSIFTAQVTLDMTDFQKKGKLIELKTGMLGEAEIITLDGSLLDRFVRSFRKLSN